MIKPTLSALMLAICLPLLSAPPTPSPAPKKAAPVALAKEIKKAAVAAKVVPGINAVAAAVQAYYNKTKTAHFSFEQSYQHPFLTTSNETSKGEVFFKAKNMLWRYLEPANRKKEFYIKGRAFTYYLVNDKTAYTHNCFERDTLSASITFLWGEGDLKKSFTIQPLVGRQNEQLNWLTLVPKEKDAAVKNISLGVDKKLAQVVESIVVDKSDGINHFKFTNFSVNQPIDDGVFNFVAPKDVTVQNMPNVTCPSAPNPSPSPPAVAKPKPVPAKPAPKNPGK